MSITDSTFFRFGVDGYVTKDDLEAWLARVPREGPHLCGQHCSRCDPGYLAHRHPPAEAAHHRTDRRPEVSKTTRPAVIALRVTQQEQDLLDQRANVNGCSRSELIRRWINQPPQSVVTVSSPATFAVNCR